MYQDFIYLRTYSRYIDESERREHWGETVDRYLNFFLPRIPNQKLGGFQRACKAIKDQKVMPSMRALWTAGEALSRDNICGYNCAYLQVDSPRAFAELMYILLCGTGVGFSVERQFISQLPEVPTLSKCDDPIVFADSKLGWASGYLSFLKALYKGSVLQYDLSKIRPMGARLKTFGGRASGPEPLKHLLDFTSGLFRTAEGRKLTSLECYDLCCYVANIVVAGGTRRSATISLSNPSDDRMKHAKDGKFWEVHPYRALANNSTAYTEKPSCTRFMQDWLALARSGSGERGVFNREGAKFVVAKIGRRDPDHEWGCNPCSEIILRPNQFCNLSEVIIRPKDTLPDVQKKVRHATILGAVQSTLTDFKFIGRNWRKNTEEERLLGVSLTGLRDHEVLGRETRTAQEWLVSMKHVAIDTAKEYSRALEIQMPAAITCVKPSGTVSQLVNSSSGLHPRYSPFYLRRVRVAANDPLARLLIDCGMEATPEVGQDPKNPTTVVFGFPVKSPETAVCRDDVSAIEQLRYWKMLAEYWCEHKPSCTIYVKDHEWMRVGSWVYDHWNLVSGVSFLPYDGGVYQLAPFQEISEAEYDSMSSEIPEVDWSELGKYEVEDMTTGAQEFACTGGACEV